MLSIMRFTVAIGLGFFVRSEVLSDAHSAGDVSIGKLKSTACSGCHGADGNSPGPLQPNLAGQDAGYIVHQLKAFKDGARPNSTMNAIAAGLSRPTWRHWRHISPARRRKVRVEMGSFQ